MSFRCSATFTFPPPEPVVCEGTTPGIIISIAGDLSSGIYWNLNTDTNGHAFTNPSAFPLEVGDSICVNEETGEVISFTTCEDDAQFFIDNTSNPITNVFPSCNLTAALAQFIVNNNIINPDVTIVITETDIGEIQVVVTINDSVTHTVAGIQIFVEDVPVFIFEAPFVCEKIRKKNGHGFFKPYVFVPIDAYPHIGRWVVDCQRIGTQVCCIAVSSSGLYVSSIQCASLRKSDNEYIEFAIAEAQLQSSFPIIPPVPVDNLLYPYDGVYGNYYRFRAPFMPSSLKPLIRNG